MIGGIVGALVFCVCCLGIFIVVLKNQKKEPGPAQAVPGAGATALEMTMPVVAMPVTGGLNADQLAKQQASPGQPVSVVATPQQAQKHSVAI